MKINEDELLRQLKHNLVIFAKDYRRIFKEYKRYENNHLSWSYEMALSSARVSGQDVIDNLGMLEYLWNKKAKEHDEKIRQDLTKQKRAKKEKNKHEK